MTPPQHHGFPFERQLLAEWPFKDWSEVSILIAVSGGPDSVALLRALVRLRRQASQELEQNPAQGLATAAPKGSLHVAHFNHGWREASKRDEVFVEDVCQSLGISLHVGRALTCHDPSGQTEETARRQRYDFLTETAERIGARYLVVAHNANDQAETILHRILRGTAIRGLTGIPKFRPLNQAVTLSRPMLWAKRSEVLTYLKQMEQPYRIDESNDNPQFTRNRIRNELLPSLAKQFNPEIVPALLRLGRAAAETEEILDQQISEAMKDCLHLQRDNRVELKLNSVEQLPETLQRRLLMAIWSRNKWPEKAMGFEQWERMTRAIAQREVTCLPGKVCLTVDGQIIRLQRSV